MREIITRYGRNNVGLWLLSRPLLLTLVMVLMWEVFPHARRVGYLNIVAFHALTGLSDDDDVAP